jgi:hypothetical protein
MPAHEPAEDTRALRVRVILGSGLLTGAVCSPSSVASVSKTAHHADRRRPDAAPVQNRIVAKLPPSSCRRGRWAERTVPSRKYVT